MLVIRLSQVLQLLPHQQHMDLSVGNEIVLSGIAFTCDYAPTGVGVQSAIYTNTTGIMTVTTSAAHGLSTTGKE